MLESDSDFSHLSLEDEKEKDHLAKDEEALHNALRKYKTAGKIKQINEIKNKDDNTSHLVNYFSVVNNKGMAPKGLGMIHRKDDVY